MKDKKITQCRELEQLRQEREEALMKERQERDEREKSFDQSSFSLCKNTINQIQCDQITDENLARIQEQECQGVDMDNIKYFVNHRQQLCSIAEPVVSVLFITVGCSNKSSSSSSSSSYEEEMSEYDKFFKQLKTDIVESFSQKDINTLFDGYFVSQDTTYTANLFFDEKRKDKKINKTEERFTSNSLPTIFSYLLKKEKKEIYNIVAFVTKKFFKEILKENPELNDELKDKLKTIQYGQCIVIKYHGYQSAEWFYKYNPNNSEGGKKWISYQDENPLERKKHSTVYHCQNDEI